MFSRIRYAARVLSYSPPKLSRAEEPDIVFEDEPRLEVNRVSQFIGCLIEILVISVGIGLASGPIFSRLFPAKEKTGLATITAIAAAFLAILGHNILQDLNVKIRLRLKLGERIAPYFGHKITKAVHTLRG